MRVVDTQREKKLKDKKKQDPHSNPEGGGSFWGQLLRSYLLRVSDIRKLQFILPQPATRLPHAR